MPREFHNPYNFVPALPRPNETLGELGDREPSGHDRFHAKLLSGKLSVKMTVETPLLLPDTAKVEVQETNSNYAKEGHKTFPVCVSADGNPEINPTAIKGMLRSAYEAITNSRLSVFQSHDERLAFRGDARDGIYVVPARIERQGAEQHIVLCPGSSIIGTGGAPELLNPDNETRGEGNRDPMYAAWLGGDAKVDKKLRVHGMKVWAYVTRWRHLTPDFLFWSVVEVRPYTVNPPTDTDIEDGRRKGDKYQKYDAANHIGEWVVGYVCLTMYKNEPNIKRRHDERIFFDKYQDQQTTSEVVTEDHRAAWRGLIVNYRQAHDNGKGGLEPAPSEPVRLEWSRHIHNAGAEKSLPDDMLCYARVELDARLGWRVLELLPVMIARRLYEEPPGNLLSSTLKPAAAMDKLSPADRVFGWVGQNVKGKNAYRGQIRIGAINCISDKVEAIEPFTQSVPLQILGQPKPQQGRFYVAEKQSGEAQTEKRNNENAGYKKDRGLRGRKVYPHHKLHEDIKKSYWDSASEDRTQKSFEADGINADTKILLNRYFQEFRRPSGKDQRDKQNRSIKGWIKPSTVFKFDIHFINLSQVELGALIWLLSLEDGYHRFGGGKPLGFGSVKLEMCRNEGKEIIDSDIRSGKEIAESRYSSLTDDKSKCVGTGSIVKEFQKAVLAAYKPNEQVTDEQIKEMFERVSFIEAFMRMAKGFEDNLPIHYPRTREEGTTNHPAPNPEGESFKWFVDNNRTRKIALPNLAEDEGLPILNHKRQGRR